MMKRWRLLLTVAVLITGGLVMTGPNAQAAAPVRHQYCHVLISPDKGLDHPSKVLAQSCSSKSSAVAKSLFDRMAIQLDGQTVTPATSTQLMVWWQSTTGSSGFGNSTVIYGSAGNCDASGYSITPNTYWQTNLSAVTEQGRCNQLQVQSIGRNNQSVVFTNPIWNLGYFNDNVGYTHIWCTVSC